MSDFIKIYVWPDNHWCYSFEIEETLAFHGKSDDYKTIFVPNDTYENIDAFVMGLGGGNHKICGSSQNKL